MNGAKAVVGSLQAAGVSICFANPGTSELHLVAAIEEAPAVRSVLCLFEGVATGAADGFGRMAPVPAAALLHQGAGLANGLANLHNARRADTPLVVVVGDSAIIHRHFDPPLESDAAGLARTVSCWLRTARSAATAGSDTAEAIGAARRAPGGVATLIVPHDVAWSPGGCVQSSVAPAQLRTAGADKLEVVAKALRVKRDVTLLLGGPTLRARGLKAADRLAQATGVRVLTDSFPSRQERGAGMPLIERLSGDPVTARRQLAGTRHLVLAAATAPVAAFAHPTLPGELSPPDCVIDRLAEADEDVVGGLEHLAELLAPLTTPRSVRPLMPICPPQGSLTVTNIAQTVAATLPDGAIVVDEANTAGPPLWAATSIAARHDLLGLRGFAIGQGLPASVGAALACPDRPVVCLEADGSAMYTLSALWTQARESLNVTTVILNNGAYSILRREARRLLGEDAVAVCAPMFDLSRPALDFVSLATGMGVPASRPRSTAELADDLRWAFTEPGPHLIEACIPAEP